MVIDIAGNCRQVVRLPVAIWGFYHKGDYMKRIKQVLAVAFMALILAGCTTLRQNESVENLLNRYPKPIYVVSISSKDVGYCSVLFRDAKGRLFTISGTQFYSLDVGDAIY